MLQKSHRLFIGNIPAGTTESDLSAEFSAYGTVESIEIKTKTNLLNDSVETFGFVNLRTDDQIVPQCVKEFKEQKYKGVYLNVSRAKESFLDKLKREREEVEAQKKNAVLLDPYNKPEGGKHVEEPKKSLPTLPAFQQGNESSSSESSESESEEDEAPPQKKTATSKPQTPVAQDSIVKKWNQETYIEYGKLKIVPITGEVTEVIDRSKQSKNRTDGKKLDGTARIADDKRKEGLSKLKSSYEQQKLAIKSALAGESLNSKKKITFSYDDNESAEKSKLSLFDEQDDDEGFKGNFSLRKQMLGEEGQKLYEMQTTYHADNRFRLDARFLDDNDKAKEIPVPQSKGKERTKQLEILSNVTGKPIITEKRIESKNTPEMSRFDPMQQRDKSNKPESEVRKQTEIRSKTAERRDDDFKVSDKKFYTVSGSFTASAANQEPNQGFSLLSLFGVANGNSGASMDVDQADEHNTAIDADKPLKSAARLRYESSDSEAEPSSKKQKKQKKMAQKVEEKQKAKAETKQRKGKMEHNSTGYYTKQGIWKESFFFFPNDVRFEAGRKFFEFFTSGNEETTEENRKSTVSLTEDDVQDLRKLYKKRRYRESRIVKSKSKPGVRRMGKKKVIKRSSLGKPRK